MTRYRKMLVTSARNYIFGNPDQGSGPPPPDDRKYFEHWRNPKEVAAPPSTTSKGDTAPAPGG